MTKMANEYVYRGLANETLSSDALHMLPAREHLPLSDRLEASEDEYRLDGKRAAALLHARSQELTPFTTAKEMKGWLESSIDGLARAYALAHWNWQAHENNCGLGESPNTWRYEKAALDLKRVYDATIAYLDARPPQLNPPAKELEETVSEE